VWFNPDKEEDGAILDNLGVVRVNPSLILIYINQYCIYIYIQVPDYTGFYFPYINPFCSKFSKWTLPTSRRFNILKKAYRKKERGAGGGCHKVLLHINLWYIYIYI